MGYPWKMYGNPCPWRIPVHGWEIPKQKHGDSKKAGNMKSNDIWLVGTLFFGNAIW